MKVPSMKHASTRAMTFLNYAGVIVIQTLVTWGLFFTGSARDLQCYYCGHVFTEWKEKDSAKYRHLQENPSCEHFQQMNKRDSDNFQGSETDTTHNRNTQYSLQARGTSNLTQNIGNLTPQSQRRAQSQSLDLTDCPGPIVQRGQYGSLQPPPQPRHSFLRDQLQQERQVDLRTREGRLTTFAEWPKNDIISPEELSMAGFKYLGSDDRVQCEFCKGILKNWQQGDRALDEHRKFFNSCPYLESLGDGIVQRSGLTLTENVPTQKQKPKPKVTESSLKAIGIIPTPDNNNLENMDTSSLGVVTARAKYPLHSVHERRVESFDSEEWKKQALPQTPNDFAKAGLFYTGPKDRVRCFFCGGGMEEWSIHDAPIDEHKRWYPECPYLEQLDTEMMHNLGSQLGASSLGAEGGTAAPSTPCKPEDTPEGKVLKEMGYDVKVIISTYELLKQEGKTNIKASDLLDKIFTEEENPTSKSIDSRDKDESADEVKVKSKSKHDDKPEEMIPTDKDYRFPVRNLENLPEKMDPLLEEARNENIKLKKMFFCWDCQDKMSNILFLPCSHMTLCEGCYKGAQSHVVCPRCKGVVRGIVKTFTS